MAKDAFYVDAAHDDDYAFAEGRTQTRPGVGAGAARQNYRGEPASEAEQALEGYASNPANKKAMRSRQRDAVAARREKRSAQPERESPLQAPWDNITDYLDAKDKYLKDPS